MSDNLWPLSESPLAGFDWPAEGCVALVLDGASIPDIARSIYEWSDGMVNTECLYAVTRWEPVSEFAPWLVWLDSGNDPIVGRFLEEGAGKEWGYFLVSDHPRVQLWNYLRQLVAIERVPGYAELLRMAHPELARSIIGEGLIGPGAALPPNVVRQVISPDMVNGGWITQEPPPRSEVADGPNVSVNLEALDLRFAAFNRRRDNLALWELLEKPVRLWLGGPSLKMAYPKLASLATEAEQQGHHSPRKKRQYLQALYHREPPASNAHTDSWMNDDTQTTARG